MERDEKRQKLKETKCEKDIQCKREIERQK
jgi:hypothetical protein